MPSRRAFLASAAAASAAGLAGCAAWNGKTTAYRSFGYGPRNRGWAGASAPTENAEEVWRVPEAVPAQVPAILDGRVFAAVGGEDRWAVASFAAGSGERQWTYEIDGSLSGWRPAVADGTLYFVDRTGAAHAVAVDGGRRRWRRSLPMEQGRRNSPVVVDDAVVFGLGRQTLFEYGGLYALETGDGAVRWHREPETGDGPDRPHTPVYPAAVGDTVYYASYAGSRGPELAAVSTADGSTRWTATPTGETRFTGVAVTDERFHLGGPQGQAAVTRADREPVWASRDGALFAPPAAAEDGAYVVTSGEDGFGVRALAPDGSERWFHTTDGAAAPSAATVADGTVYYGGRDGRLYALDAATGDPRWWFGEDGIGVRTPAVVGGSVYAVSGDGLVAIRAP